MFFNCLYKGLGLIAQNKLLTYFVLTFYRLSEIILNMYVNNLFTLKIKLKIIQLNFLHLINILIDYFEFYYHHFY